MRHPRGPWRPIQLSIYSAGPAKPLIWVGGTFARLSRFPTAARQEAGRELRRVQLGRDPKDSRPMPSVGSGVVEIRVHSRGEYRVMYVAKFSEGIYVLHAFEKRTQQARRLDIEAARRSLAEVRRNRPR